MVLVVRIREGDLSGLFGAAWSADSEYTVHEYTRVDLALQCH
jgi:hypothetical protein